MTIVLTVLISNTLILLSFCLGAKIAIKIKKDEKININPIAAIQEDKRIKENKEKIEKVESEFLINLENIENYSGDSTGQRDF